MNTKFDVGQRVTYPVVHTADGNITGIAVSKSGVTRYAIGPKWYTEDDLKPSAEEKPDIGNPITEPVSESNPEPVKLYCVKGYGKMCKKGKTYAANADGHLKFDNGQISTFETDNTRFKQEWSEHLVPLVCHPAKVGEWVLPSDWWFERRGIVTRGIFKVESVDADGDIWFDGHNRCAGLSTRIQYLVLDGYTGDPA